jgi:GT2 family glycosyltransferase
VPLLTEPEINSNADESGTRGLGTDAGDRATVSAIVVAFADPAATHAAVDSLLGQSHAPLEVLLVDNHPDGLTSRAMSAWEPDPRLRLVQSGPNLGYTAACNRAAAQARGDWLFFLNPDARADPACLSTLVVAADERSGVMGAQVLLPDGRTNAGDNPLHITGIAWSGRFGEPREHGLARRVGSVSGAALLARTQVFSNLGGMCERFFMYEDDVDLCWRMRLAGWEVVFCPEAVVWHEYEFEKGAHKWFWLERNRLWAVLSNYSAVSLLLLSPLLVCTELIVAARAVREGWARELVCAWGATLMALPALLRWRHAVQSRRRVADSELLGLMWGRFETTLLESAVARAVNPLGTLYRRILRGLLRAAGR